MGAPRPPPPSVAPGSALMSGWVPSRCRAVGTGPIGRDREQDGDPGTPPARSLPFAAGVRGSARRTRGVWDSYKPANRAPRLRGSDGASVPEKSTRAPAGPGAAAPAGIAAGTGCLRPGPWQRRAQGRVSGEGDSRGIGSSRSRPVSPQPRGPSLHPVPQLRSGRTAAVTRSKRLCLRTVTGWCVGAGDGTGPAFLLK